MRRVLAVARVVWLEMLRRKEPYVVAVMLAALLGLLLSVDVFGIGGAVRYVMDIGLLAAWIFSLVLAVAGACRQLPDEERRGTVFPLLAKPLTRLEMICGKWLGAWSAASCAGAGFFLAVGVVVKGRGGAFDWLTLAQGWVVCSAGLAAVAAMGMALSTRMSFGAASSVSWTMLAASFFMLPRIPERVLGAPRANAAILSLLYYALPHFELFDMRLRIVHRWGNIPARALALLLAYGAVLTSLGLCAAWLAYRNKRLERGGVS